MAEFVEDKIMQSIHDRKNLNSRFSENCSTYNSFLELERKTFNDGTLSRKSKELMVLAISM